MALQSALAPIAMPSYLIEGAKAARVYTLDAADEYTAGVFQIPQTGTLKKIGFRTGTVTVPDTILVRLEAVDVATGLPDGNLLVANSNGSQTDPAANTTYWVALNGTTGVSVTKGTIAAVKITLDFVDGNLQIANNIVATSTMPYIINALPTAVKSLESPNIGLEYDTGIVQTLGCFPATVSTLSSTWTTAAFKKGLAFTVPFSCRITAAIIQADIDNDSECLFYSSDQATVLETIALDKDIRGSAGTGLYLLQFVTPRTLLVNTKYRLVIQPSGGANISYPFYTVTDDGAVAAMAGLAGGVTWHYTECNGAPANEASWTDTLTVRPHFGILIDQLDDGAGSGGGRPEIRGGNL